MPQPTINWPGQSGREYTYKIYSLSTEFKRLPGNYVFARENTPGKFLPVYIGETSDLSERFDNHHKMPCIRKHGATHICVHTSSADEEIRRAEEDDLITKWRPPCND